MLAWWLACLPGPPPGPAPAERARGPRPPVAIEAPAPLVHLQVTLRAGSACDPPGAEGLAWLAAHAVAAGGTPDLPPVEVARALTSMGAEIAVEVGPELAALRLSAPAEAAEEAADLLGALVAHPVLDPGALPPLREQAHAALTGLAARELALRVLDRWTNEGHPYGHAPEGRTAILPRLELDDVEAFLDARWVLPGAWAGAAGPGARAAAARLAGALADLPDRPVDPPTPALRSPPAAATLLVVERPGEVEGAVALGQPVEIDRADPAWPALDLAAAVLAERLAVASGAPPRSPVLAAAGTLDAGAPPPWRHPGAARLQEALTVALPGPATPAALGRAAAVLDAWAEAGPTPEELARARRVRALPPPALPQRLALALEARALGLPDPIEELPARWAAADAETVRAALAAWVRPAGLRWVAVTGTAEALAANPSLPFEEVFVVEAAGLFR